MSLAQRSVARPIFTTMVTLIVVVIGVVSLVEVQSDLLPPIELPSLSVSTEYPGANPQVMERLVTEVVEEIVATVPGIEELRSQSSEGNSEVSLRFAWGTDLDTAATDVRAKLEDELSELPEGINRPQIRKFDIASFPIVILGVSSPLDPVELTTIVEEQIAPRIARIPGVAQVDPWGEYVREIRVEIDPERLRAYNIPLDTVQQAVERATLDLATGSIEAGDQEVALRAPSELQSLEDLERTVVVLRNGAPVRVGDLATVVDTHERLQRLARIDGELGLRLGVRKEADANTVTVSEAILAEIDEINEDLTQARVISVVNQGDFIQRSIANVARSVLYGGVLAILVLFFFLRSVRSTLIIAIAIPISLVATFAVIYLAGLTLNLMTLGGLALGVGMMVDNSIVVLDSIYRRQQEKSESRAESAVRGTAEVSAAIIASTLTTVVIFLPLAFVQGVSGQLFRELAYVVAFSLGCSLLVSLSVVPMLTSRLLKVPTDSDSRSGWLARLDRRTERGLDGLDESYRGALARALTRPWRVVALCAACLLASIAIVPTLESELLPPSDEGSVIISGEMPTGTRLALVDDQTRLMEAMVEPLVPEAIASVVSVGSSGRRPGDAGKGEIQLSLNSSAERSRSNEEVADALRDAIDGEIPGMQIRVRAPQGQFLLQRILGDDADGLTVEILGPDLERLDALAEQVAEIASRTRGVTDVDRSRDESAPQVDLRTDREAAADRGVDASDVANAIEIAVAGREAGDYRVGASSYRILVQLADAPQRSLSEILDLTVEGAGGVPVPLADVTTWEEVSAPLVIDRKEQRRIVTVRANVAGRALGSVAAELESQLDDLVTPDGFDVQVAGTYEEQERASSELSFAFLLALILVYMVLAAQYESLRDPWVVMLSVPTAATGVFVALGLTGTTLNVQSYIGCIMLGGIVVNSAVLLVDQTSQLRRAGMPLREALLEAGRKRLRPILMTTSTTALALVPLALGIGEGADAQAPMARAVLGGLMASTAFTLLLVPAAYALAHRKLERRTLERRNETDGNQEAAS